MKQIKQNKKLIVVCFLIAAIGVFGLHKPAKPAVQPSAVQTPTAPKSITNAVPMINLSSALAAANPLGRTLHVQILMYHHVGNLPGNADALARDLTVSPTDFEAQVEYFKNLGYETVTIQQAYAALEYGSGLPAKPIIFSFDDGYQDVFINAVPILKAHGYVGSFAIATELLGRPTYAVWNDILQADQQGMEIVSHSENHLDLTNPIYSPEDLQREIAGSNQVLEQKLGHDVDFFVYPYGKHNPAVENLVGQAGYKVALTTDFGENIKADTLLVTPRVRVHGGAEGLDKLKKIFSPRLHSGSGQPNP